MEPYWLYSPSAVWYSESECRQHGSCGKEDPRPDRQRAVLYRHRPIGNLLNAANAVGVDSCYIWRAREVFDSEEGRALKAAFGIPEEYIGVGNVILGYGKPEGKRPAAPRKADYIRKV